MELRVPSALSAYSILEELPLLAASAGELAAYQEAVTADRRKAQVVPAVGRETAPQGKLPVGLRLVPDAFDDGQMRGIRVSELREIAPLVRELRDITVRGCLVTGNLTGLHGKALGGFFRAAYESAKLMTVLLPCAMPYLILEDGLPALLRNKTEHPDTYQDALTAAQIMAAQNETAFYARLYFHQSLR